MPGLSDGGAHVGVICDGSFPTYNLLHWAKDRTRGPKLPIEHVVHRQTQKTASHVGWNDRGVVGEGRKADLNVIDLDSMRLHPPRFVYDLPCAGRRLLQDVDGYVATVCSGAVTFEHGEHTGELPGRVVRGATAARGVDLVTATALSPDLVGAELPTRTVSWTKHDVLLYAVGVGARPDNGLDFIYEGRGPKVLPTYAVVPGMNIIGGLSSVVRLDLARLLHGEQGITLHRPLPPEATVTSTSRIVEVWDKGKAGVVGMEGTCSDDDGPLFSVYSSLFVIGGGGFGGERGPSSSKARAA